MQNGALELFILKEKSTFHLNENVFPSARSKTTPTKMLRYIMHFPVCLYSENQRIKIFPVRKLFGRKI